MAANILAQQAEKTAFKKVQKLLGEAKAFAKPAGFETSFPDFGFRLYYDQKPIDIHIEYKADAKVQMGSMRDWVFDGTKFTTSTADAAKIELIDIMNSSPEALRNAKRLLNDLKKYYDKRVQKLYSGSLTVVTDRAERRAKVLSFRDNTHNYHIAKIENEQLGQKVIDHYKKKFVREIKPDAAYSVLLMMIGNDIYFVDERGATPASMRKIVAERFNVRSINKLTNLKAHLEVRVQPSGLNNPDRMVTFDVMASYRLAGKPPAGATIIS